MLKKLFSALTVAAACASSHATTQYNFWFETVGGYTNDAYLVWNGSAVIGGGGTVTSDFNPIWNGATMTNFSGSSLNVFTFKLNTTGNIVYTANFTATPAGQEYPGQLSWISGTKTAIYGFSGLVSPTGTVYGDVPNAVREDFGLPLVQVPEIDGEKLPQVALLIGGLFLAYRSRKFLKLPAGGLAQPA